MDEFKAAALCLFVLVACGPAASPSTVAPDEPATPDATQRPAFCARGETDDAVTDVFCSDTPPVIRSLQDLYEALGIMPGAQGALWFPVVLGHSTALEGRLVSPINPRVFILGGHTITAFQRGAQRVELATATQGKSNSFNFYLLSFRRACDADDDGCSFGELYTPRVESDWTEVELRSAEDLKDTASDCRQCHQRGRENATLLMRELRSPWTHFFDALPAADAEADALPGVRNSDLLRDFLKAKGDEAYAGALLTQFPQATSIALAAVASIAQPLVFDAPSIESERWPRGPDGYADAPLPSPTWDRSYAAFKRGEQLALPYVEQRATDPQKQAKLTDAYARYRSGEIDADELPDMADIFPDDPHVRAQIGLQTEPDATPADALIQACGTCHNDVLDQTISRARFSIDVARLDRAELELAVERIQRPATEPGAMPPAEARQLDPQTRDRLLAYLQQDPRTTEFDDTLARAARLGMNGPAATAN